MQCVFCTNLCLCAREKRGMPTLSSIGKNRLLALSRTRCLVLGRRLLRLRALSRTRPVEGQSARVPSVSNSCSRFQTELSRLPARRSATSSSRTRFWRGGALSALLSEHFLEESTSVSFSNDFPQTKRYRDSGYAREFSPASSRGRAWTLSFSQLAFASRLSASSQRWKV